MNNTDIATLIAQNIDPLVSMIKWFIGVVAVIFISAIVWSWRLSAVVNGFRSALAGIERRIGGIEKRMDSADERMGNVENYLHKLSGHLGEKAPQFGSFTQINSPITLTERGKEMAHESGFADFAKAHQTLWGSIADAAKGRLDAEAYIEKNAFKQVHDLFDQDDPRIARVSLYMFEHGLRHDEAIYEAILKAFGVVARDAAFVIAGINVPVPSQKEDGGE